MRSDREAAVGSRRRAGAEGGAIQGAFEARPALARGEGEARGRLCNGPGRPGGDGRLGRGRIRRRRDLPRPRCGCRVGVAGRIGGADGEVVCAGGEATELERRAAPREGSRIETAGEARARLAGEEGEAGARVGRRLARAGVDCCLGCGRVDDADRPRAAGGRRVGVACRVDRAYLEAVRAGDEAAVLPWGRAGREGNSVEPPPCAQLGLSAGCGSRPRPTRRAAERRHG